MKQLLAILGLMVGMVPISYRSIMTEKTNLSSILSQATTAQESSNPGPPQLIPYRKGEPGLTPVVWMRHLREAPLAGLYPKSVIYLFAKGDQQAANPGASSLIRAGNLADRTLYYRHDLAFAQDPSPTMPKNPHLFAGMPTHPNALFRSISRGVQDRIGAFLASGGAIIIHPEPARFFEVPLVGPLPEDLDYIP